MEEPFYPFSVSESKLVFEFESVSNYAKVRKVIVYSRMNIPGFYNLALLDETTNGTTSDVTVTDNKDMKFVLATVYQTMLVFLNGYAGSRIFFMGNTPARTRLYRIAINRELVKVSDLLLVQGFVGSIFEPFAPNRDYMAFLISRK